MMFVFVRVLKNRLSDAMSKISEIFKWEKKRHCLEETEQQGN
jgi:hypothetical protein